MSVSSQRSHRSTSSCSSFSDATTLVDENDSFASIKAKDILPTYESALAAYASVYASACAPAPVYASSSSGSSSPPLPPKSRAAPSSPLYLQNDEDSTASSPLMQLLCKVFPTSKLAKKMKNAPKEGEDLYKEMSVSDKEKLEAKKERLLAVDKRIAEEFGRMGW